MYVYNKLHPEAPKVGPAGLDVNVPKGFERGGRDKDGKLATPFTPEEWKAAHQWLRLPPGVWSKDWGWKSMWVGCAERETSIATIFIDVEKWLRSMIRFRERGPYSRVSLLIWLKQRNLREKNTPHFSVQNCIRHWKNAHDYAIKNRTTSYHVIVFNTPTNPHFQISTNGFHTVQNSKSKISISNDKANHPKINPN